MGSMVRVGNHLECHYEDFVRYDPRRTCKFNFDNAVKGLNTHKHGWVWNPGLLDFRFHSLVLGLCGDMIRFDKVGQSRVSG